MTQITFFPYPFMVTLLLLVLAVTRRRKRGWLYGSILTAFGLYLMLMMDLAVFPIHLPADWPASQPWRLFSFRDHSMINLNPLNLRYLFWYVSSGMGTPAAIVREIGGNILLTVPFGLGVNLFLPVPRRLAGWFILAGGLMLEAAQLLILVVFGPSMHSVDINDVLFNTLGVWLGWLMYRLAFRGWRLEKQRPANRLPVQR